jgi:hypothetical protein
MKFIAVFIFQIIYFSVYAQKKKPVYYYDVNDTEIQQKTFKNKYSKPNNNGIYYLKLLFENDTSYIEKLVLRKNYGKLNQTEIDKLNNELNEYSFKPVADFTIIQYHPGKDECNSGRLYFKGANSAYENSYLKRLKKKMNFKNYRVYKQDSTLDYSILDGYEWQFDKNKTIETLFFKHHYPCMSFVIINNKTRNYISIYGEYGAKSVTKIAEEMLNKS